MGEGVENVYAAAGVLQAQPFGLVNGLRRESTAKIDRLRPAIRARSKYSLDKLRGHLDDSPPEIYQLMAEVLYVHFLIFGHQISGDVKRGHIEDVLRFGAPISMVPDAVASGLTPGVAYSPPLFIHRRAQLGFILEFAEQWKESLPAERGHRLDNPWEFRDFANDVDLRSELLRKHAPKVRAQRWALLHLVFPDTFERLLGSSIRDKVIKEFAHLVTDETTDTDRALQQIRSALEAQYGEDYDFIAPPPREDGPPREGDHRDDPTDPTGPDLAGLARELLLTEPGDFLHRIEKLLEDKRQVIFQGPPGTGKTYVAQELAQHLAGPDGSVTLVQMHPSYAYEDFVRGFRPTLRDGQAGFELRDGPLLQAAEAARARPDATHFLIIDEINRGNVAKVFGELYFLLEYRDRGIRLQYQSDGEAGSAHPADSDEAPGLDEDPPRDGEAEFSLPPNLYFIGTMNTADRSIALVDLALRRRFYFVEFHPDFEPIKGLLRRWLAKNASEMGWVADVVDRANELLRDDRHAAIGPSYFMKPGLDDEAVERIWTHSVLPYVEECLYGQHDRLSEFDLDALRTSGGLGAPQADGAPPDEHQAPSRDDSGDTEEAE